jgi:hypothetical protein
MEMIQNPQFENTKEWGGRHNCLVTVEEETEFTGEYSEKPKQGI